MKSRYNVEFGEDYGEDYIKILKEGIEVLYWIEDEWKEDPQVVFSIANAIYLSQRSPDKLEKLLPKLQTDMRNPVEDEFNYNGN